MEIKSKKRVIEILRDYATTIKECHTIRGEWDEKYPGALEEHDELVALSKELEAEI